MKIKIKIDVTKINKGKLYKGAKGTYLDATLIATTGSKYGDDFFIVQELGKGPDGKYEKGPILGNGRILGGKSQSSDAANYNSDGTNANSSPAAQSSNGADEDVPF